MQCIICNKQVEKLIALNVLNIHTSENMKMGECISCAQERYNSLLKMENDLPWRDGEYVDSDGIKIKIVRPSETLANSIKEYKEIQ